MPFKRLLYRFTVTMAEVRGRCLKSTLTYVKAIRLPILEGEPEEYGLVLMDSFVILLISGNFSSPREGAIFVLYKSC